MAAQPASPCDLILETALWRDWIHANVGSERCSLQMRSNVKETASTAAWFKHVGTEKSSDKNDTNVYCKF